MNNNNIINSDNSGVMYYVDDDDDDDVVDNFHFHDQHNHNHNQQQHHEHRSFSSVVSKNRPTVPKPKKRVAQQVPPILSTIPPGLVLEVMGMGEGTTNTGTGRTASGVSSSHNNHGHGHEVRRNSNQQQNHPQKRKSSFLPSFMQRSEQPKPKGATDPDNIIHNNNTTSTANTNFYSAGEINNNNNGHHEQQQTEDDGNTVDIAHALLNKIRGESEVEALGARIEERQQDRITVIKSVRKKFVITCRKKSLEENRDGRNLEMIKFTTLKKWRDEIILNTQKPTSKSWVTIKKLFGFRSTDEQLLSILEKGIEIVTFQKDRYFYFMDFNVYYVRTESRWPWMRNSALLSVLAMLFFYTFTPILFCYIAPDENICPTDPTDQNRSYYGAFKALYFASATLSTVGYGDITVSKDSDLKILIGMFYMVLANVMLIVAFSNAAGSIGIFDNLNQSILKWIWGNDDSELVYKKVRRASFLRIGQIAVTFIFLNWVGILITKLIITFGPKSEEEKDIKMNWIEAMYWAVQTTTTIGYGDITLTTSAHMFQIFYLILSTYFVGNTLGGLAALKDEIAGIISHTAWSRRKVSRGLIDELQPYEHDGRIDQYEWAIASLMILGKVKYEELVPIMDKFRELSADSGFIESPNAEDIVMPLDDEENAQMKKKKKKKKHRHQEVGHHQHNPQFGTTIGADREEDIPSHIEYGIDDDLGEFDRGMLTLFGLNI